MTEQLKLMAVLAHPDDESLGTGGALARYAAEGIETHLVTATRGERGWLGEPDDYPGPQELGRIREAELRAAADVLGLQEVTFLDYLDGELERVNPAQAIGRIVSHIRRVRPQVILTFDPYGSYGHPDHIAISQLTTAAVVAAADPTYSVNGVSKPYRVSKLYYLAATVETLSVYQAAFGELVMVVNGVERRAVGWPAWAITTQIDSSAYQKQVWQAVTCHQSQLRGLQSLIDLPREQGQQLFKTTTFYRAYSLVNSRGQELENDLFEGLLDGDNL